MQNRLPRHLVFWLSYFIISLFNELYLSDSFSLHPTLELFLQCILALSPLMIIKIGVVYVFLYRIIPQWINPNKKSTALAESILALLGGTLLIRLIMRYVIWALIYHEVEELDPLRWLARYFYSLLDLLQIVGVAVAIKLHQLRLHALENEKNLIREKLKAEILHLKAQINPHFLFNTLNSIYAMARDGSELTADALMKLSRILRYILYEAGNKTVPLLDEIKIMEDYIALQKLRFGHRIEVSFKHHLHNENCVIAPLLLLPLLENAFKHSNHLQAKIVFDVVVSVKGLYLRSSNPIVEQSVKERNSDSGIGLTNIKRQLQLLYADAKLEHAEKNGQFTLNLYIDLDSYVSIEMFDNRR